MTLRIVAGDKDELNRRDSVSDPTGSPVSTYASTNSRKISIDRLLSSATVNDMIYIFPLCFTCSKKTMNCQERGTGSGMESMRNDNRKFNELRPVFLGPGFAKYAEG